MEITPNQEVQKTEVRENHNLIDRALSETDLLIKQKGIGYFVIGSIARRAYMGVSIDDKNEIDIIVPDKSRSQEANDIFKLVESRNTGVEIDSSLSDFLQKDEKGFSLKRGNVESRLDASIMQEQRVTTPDGTSFSTLLPETLLHTFILSGSLFRPKDWHNSLEFARWVRGKTLYDHDLQVPFHNFARDQWMKSPLRRVQFMWRKLVRSMPGPEKEILRKIYQNNAVVFARETFNYLERVTCGVETNKS